MSKGWTTDWIGALKDIFYTQKPCIFVEDDIWKCLGIDRPQLPKSKLKNGQLSVSILNTIPTKIFN